MSDPLALLAAIRSASPAAASAKITSAIPARALANALRQGGGVVQLILSGNTQYTDAEFCDIMEALSLNTELRTLDLSEMDLACDRLEHVAELVQHATNLRRLDLSHNDVDPDAAAILGDALRNHPAMRTLVLRDVDLRDDGCEALLSTLRPSECGLHKLTLPHNHITPVGAAMLAEYTKASSTLTQLALSGNSVPERDAAAIALHLQRNVDKFGCDPASRPASQQVSRAGARPPATAPQAPPHAARFPQLSCLVMAEGAATGKMTPSLTLLMATDG